LLFPYLSPAHSFEIPSPFDSNNLPLPASPYLPIPTSTLRYFSTMNYPPSLNKFFIFDRRLGTKEGTEEEKILYFYPPNLKVEDKTNHVGLCEGIIQFAGYALFLPLKIFNFA
jgi:hypothetical protein